MAVWEDVYEKLILVEGWARDGATMQDIADNLNISRTTLYNLMDKHKELKKAVKNGKEVIDYAVENALLKKALNGDVTAQIFWLKNRKSAQWRDRHDLEHSGKIEMPQIIITK
jgi:predicted DNA-binding protein YlxM (UPF0122 family)